MNIQTVKIKWAENELSQNTHIVEFENGCVVIDAGCSVEQIKEITDKEIKAVFITHGHFDHIKNIEEYDKLNIPLYASKEIEQMLKNPMLNVSLIFGCEQTFNVKNIKFIENNQEIDIDGHKILCLKTSGHSVDSFSFLIDKTYLFSGDTVFSVAVGRDDLPTGNTDELIKSLTKILNLDYKILYTGHGRPSSKDEQKTNIPKWINYLSKKENLKWEK